MVLPSSEAAFGPVGTVSTSREVLKSFNFLFFKQKIFEISGGFIVQADNVRDGAILRPMGKGFLVGLDVGCGGTGLHRFYMYIAVETT